VRERCPDLGPASHVLSLGPRNEVELRILEELGLGRATGLDLWPASRRIRRGDMHAMPFADGAFDLVFASHVLEHAYDFGAVAAECLRVLRRPGLVFAAVPTNFVPNEHDRTLFRSVDDLLAPFRVARPEVLYASESPRELTVLFRLGGGEP
jgi:SAM-dependent methyltransferase